MRLQSKRNRWFLHLENVCIFLIRHPPTHFIAAANVLRSKPPNAKNATILHYCAVNRSADFHWDMFIRAPAFLQFGNMFMDCMSSCNTRSVQCSWKVRRRIFVEVDGWLVFPLIGVGSVFGYFYKSGCRGSSSQVETFFVVNQTANLDWRGLVHQYNLLTNRCTSFQVIPATRRR